ncbi:MAG: hypothetical protein PHO37_11165 [Kiritimatiellae bacterium]|nr:hypothetical protein [Kiritimatiellia bacterium]
MKYNHGRLLLSAFGVCFVLLSLPSFASIPPAEPPSEDSGYFLSCKQKGQLIWQGRMQDSSGSWYDIWIVPGYVDPARQCRINTLKAGGDFAEYGHRQKYKDLGDASSDAFDWAYDDCLMDFALKGSKKAWSESWKEAGKRTQKRVFGWWLAYPWAVLESTLSTVVRIPVGAAGTVLGSAWGGAVVPVYYGVNSTVKGTLRFGVRAVALPASAVVWNTAASPLMALVGQKPAPSRVDGFWVTQLSGEELQSALQAQEPVSREELEALARWGIVLLTASEPFDVKRKELREQANQQRTELNQRFSELEKNLSQAEQQALRAAASSSELQATISLLRESGFDSRKTARAARELRSYLEKELALSAPEASRILQLLKSAPPPSAGSFDASQQ